MIEEVQARLRRFARQTIDLHLPLLVGMIAERGGSAEEQIQRASALITMLSNARVAPQLMANGRPIPVDIQSDSQGHQLLLNGQMAAGVDDSALAGAMALPVGRILKLSPTTVGLVLQTSDEQQVRGLSGQISARAQVVALTQVQELVRWRLDTLEQRLTRLVNEAGGRLKSPEAASEEFVRALCDNPTGWPQFSLVRQAPYIEAWTARVRGELGHTSWADSAEKLVEMLWESLVISPRSALRQAAQTLRSLSLKGNHGRLLEVLAIALGEEGEPVPARLQAWPTFQELLKSWEGMWREEDDALGARRRGSDLPTISVFQPPGESIGFSEPENLPWEQPLLCWTMRERAALRDLLCGMEQSLSRSRTNVRSGRLEGDAFVVATPLQSGEPHRQWHVQVPGRLPAFSEAFAEKVNRAFAATLASYMEAFADLGMAAQIQALNRARGAYKGYLSSTRSIWERRLASSPDASPKEVFLQLTTGLARALEWPIFVDVFEEGVQSPPAAQMPSFTLLALWTEEAAFAPVWLPVETIGEALGQAPLRIRNVAVTAEGGFEWIGDHRLESSELRALSTDGLMRAVHESTLLITIHRD